MISYVLLCDSKISVLGGTFEITGTYLNSYLNMFTAQRAIAQYYLPPNVVKAPNKEEFKFRHKNAIFHEIYLDRSQNSVYTFYIVQVDLEDSKND